MCVIEEKSEGKIKVFDLIKNMLDSNDTDKDKNIFLYALSDFSDLSNTYPHIDLAVIGDCNIDADIKCPENIKSILLNIDNSDHIKLNKNIQVITCGLKEKDTAIFSSINLDEGNVILDLQRSIKNINGETIEPFEKQIDIPDFASNLKIKTEDMILAFTTLTFCSMI
ncbi:MAG: hypothetical protein FWF92_01030 [Oscillospiraceae bacterium]|nr:hypothetical protein [Oscillospiraceae bacterium]